MNTSDKSVKAQSISILCSILKRRRLHHRYLVYVYSNQTTGFRGWGQAGTWKSKECLQFVIYRTWVRANLSAVIPKMVVKKMYPHLISNSVSDIWASLWVPDQPGPQQPADWILLTLRLTSADTHLPTSTPSVWLPLFLHRLESKEIFMTDGM